MERSAGIIIFRESPASSREYLIIRSSRQDLSRPEFWDFAKGLLKPGEKGLEAARREAKEEVGLEKFEIREEFKETVRYFTRRDGKPIPKFVAMFLAKVELGDDEIVLSWEHDQYLWLPYQEAHDRLSLPQMKKALEAAETFLAQKHES